VTPTDDALALLRLRTLLVSRVLLPAYTDEARREAPVRLAVVVGLALLALIALAQILAFLFARVFAGAAAADTLLPILSWGATMSSVGIFFYGALTLSATLTNRTDLHILLLAPLSTRVVLAERVLGVSATFSVLVAVIGLPNMLATGVVLSAGMTLPLAAIAAVVLLPITPTAVALLLVTGVLRTVPARRARVAAVCAAAVATAALYLATEGGFGQATIGSRSVDLLPTHWVGDGLAAAASSDSASATAYLLASTLLAGAAVALAASAAGALLQTGWGSYGELSHRRTQPRGAVRALPAFEGTRDVKGTPWAALFRREWLLLRRDPKLLAQLAYPILLEGFTLFKAIGNPFTTHALTGRLARLFAASLYLSASLTALFLLTIFALPMVSREGRSLYLLAISPLAPRAIFLSKIAFCGTPVVALVEIALFGIGTRLLRLSPLDTLLDAAAFAALLTALACWLVCVGIIWPRLGGDTSRRQISGTALLVGPTTGAGFCGLIGWLLGAVYLAPPDETMTRVISGALVFALPAAVIAACLATGPRLLRDLLEGDRRPG
jgi:hypothetical protein